MVVHRWPFREPTPNRLATGSEAEPGLAGPAAG